MAKTLQYEIHVQGDIPCMVNCPDGQMFVDPEQGIYAFVPVGKTEDEKRKSAAHFAKMCILGGMFISHLEKINHIVKNYHEIPYKEVKVIEKDGEKFASYNLSAGGTLELAVEGDTADLYVDNEAKAFYLCEKHKGTFLARIEGELFVKELDKKAAAGDEEAHLTLELMKEYVCLKDEHICW